MAFDRGATTGIGFGAVNKSSPDKIPIASN